MPSAIAQPGVTALDMPQICLVFGAGVLAGIANAIAGGGTFFTFPALLYVGVPPVLASASSALATWPGHAAAIPPYWSKLRLMRTGMLARCGVALAGGVVGALLLLRTSNRFFETLVPWLLLFATLVFACGPRLQHHGDARRATVPPSRAALGIEFLFAVYGGFFGAGLGVLLLAALSLLGHDDMHEANALKNLLASVVTSIAVAIFIAAGSIAWPQTLWTLAGAVVGGFGGAAVAQRIPPAWLRRAVVTFGLILAAYFFLRPRS
jgi:uncharacterized membrane protein YfcA